MEGLAAGDPSHIGPFRLLGRLGTGGTGRVYLARSAGGRTVAVRLVQEEYAHRDGLPARFAREVAAARRVDGEWTARVLDAGMSDGIRWVATEYVPGPSLQDAVAGDFGPLPERSLLVLAHRLALALDATHRLGLVHPGLKPSNVLLTADGPRLVSVGAPWERTPTTVGALSEAGDVFRLGLVLAYAATGRLPFGDTDGGAHSTAPGEPDLTGVPPVLLPLVRSCLHKDPDQRPAPRRIARRTATDPHPPSWLPIRMLAQVEDHRHQLWAADDLRTGVRTGGYRPPVPELGPNPRNDFPPEPGAFSSAPDLPRRRSGVALAAAVGGGAAVVAAALGFLFVQSPGTPAGRPASPSPTHSTPHVPHQFLGTWKATTPSTGTTYTVTITETKIAERLKTYVEGGATDRLCVWTSPVVAADSRRLSLGRSEPVDGGPGAGCAAGPPHQYVFTGADTLRLHYPDVQSGTTPPDITLTREAPAGSAPGTPKGPTARDGSRTGGPSGHPGPTGTS
ncbi:serine/threonine-protein kinase [Streptomyces sp. cg36]|uniref:serine/threonine-protein kinase n=1 Tax=Streptomyces sp. cg36 TaxID=3238798 RepID=UPI0034E25DDD